MSKLKVLLSIPRILILILYHVTGSFVLLLIPRSFRKKKDIKEQNVLITGAGAGVGRALAIEFSKYSVSLILVGRTRETLIQTEKLLDRSSRVFIYECDVSNNEMVCKMAQNIKEHIGDVNILVNNAGVVQGKYLTDSCDEETRKTLDVNVLAHMWTCKAFLPAMMQTNSGHIVSIGSLAGKIGVPQMTDYCSSKFAAIGFAETLELELRERNLDGIKITVVLPAQIHTTLCKGMETVLTPTLTPEHVAQEIVYGILTDAETVFLPNYAKYSLLLKELLPRWITIKSLEMTGEIKCMKNFTGNTKNINGQLHEDSSKSYQNQAIVEEV